MSGSLKLSCPGRKKVNMVRFGQAPVIEEKKSFASDRGEKVANDGVGRTVGEVDCKNDRDRWQTAHIDGDVSPDARIPSPLPP